VRVIDNIFNDQELTFCKQQFQDALKGEWQINKFLWQPYLTEGYDGYVLMQNVSDRVRDIVLENVQKHVQYKQEPGIMFYMWSEGSAINWHHDDHVDKACTIYLNNWPIDRGGQFVYRDEHKQTFVPIIENRMVINDNHTEHKVTPVKKSKEIRYTLQVFGT